MSVGSTIFFPFPLGPGSGVTLVKFKHTDKDLTHCHVPSLPPVHTVHPDPTRHDPLPAKPSAPQHRACLRLLFPASVLHSLPKATVPSLVAIN